MNPTLIPAIYIDSKKTLKFIKTIDKSLAEIEYKTVKGKYFIEVDDEFLFETKKDFLKMYSLAGTVEITIAACK